jgi:diaminopimelate epimerase
MDSPQTLHVSKMHGAGNDIIILDLRGSKIPSPSLCRALANRHTGVGGDMVIAVKQPRSHVAVSAYEIWTAEGLPSKQCGNGARCVAAWVIREGLVSGKRFALDSPSGTHWVDVLDEQLYQIELGRPEFRPDHIPIRGFANQSDSYNATLEDGTNVRFSAVSTGNPHAVIEVDDIATAQVSALGPYIQQLNVFLPTVNVGFVQVVSRDLVFLRVYEFGAGETLACGSGACAAVAVLIKQGRLNRNVEVVLPGGSLRVVWPADDAPINLIGPATFVFEGEFNYASVQ